MNAQDLIHKWANGAIKGKASNLQIVDKGSLGTAIMHYATELALRTDDGRLFVHNQTPYSKSTQKVQSYIRRSIPGAGPVVIWDQRRGFNFTYHDWKKAVIDCRANEIHSLSRDQATQKAKRLGTINRIQGLIVEVERFATGDNAHLLSEDDRASLHQAWKNAKQWELEELPKQAKYQEAQNKRDASAQARRDAQSAALKAESEERKRIAQLTEQEKIEAWRNGETVGCTRLPMMLRIKGDKVETSHGASVSIAEAVRGMKIIDHIRAGRHDHIAAGALSELPTLDGLYKILSVNGEIVIGCHHIPWEEYEKFKPVLAHHIALARPQA